MWEKLIVAVILGLMQWVASRKDQTDAAKGKVYRELWQNAKLAYEWEAGAAAQPNGGAGLRVEKPDRRIKLSPPDSNGSGPTA